MNNKNEWRKRGKNVVAGSFQEVDDIKERRREGKEERERKRQKRGEEGERQKDTGRETEEEREGKGNR